MVPRSQFPALQPQLANRTRPLSQNLVRAMHAKYWQDPFALKRPRAARSRGRFNAAAGANVLYLGDDYLTCTSEALVAAVPTWPVAFASVACQLQAVLDLRDPGVQRLLQTDDEELGANFRAQPLVAPPTPTQLLGEFIATHAVLDAFLYSSAARPGRTCLAVFMDGLHLRGCRLEVFDPRNGIDHSFP